MPASKSDYFRYFSPGAGPSIWGLALTASGHTRILPATSYPPARHPAGHHFDWSHGRVLEALQIVFIKSGRGRLEMRNRPVQGIEMGMAFALPPGVWHRYRPDADVGWTESWMEVQGPVVNRLLSAGLFSNKTAVHLDASSAGLDTALERVHAIASEAGPGFDPELAARAFAVLVAWSRSGLSPPELSRLRRAILTAERHLAENLAKPVNIAALAKKLGVSYSQFRQEFRKHTGFAPWQYVLHVRIIHARRLLAGSDAQLEEIATQLGFSSAFHFSTAFKQAMGISPDRWRRQLRTRADRARTSAPHPLKGENSAPSSTDS